MYDPTIEGEMHAFERSDFVVHALASPTMEFINAPFITCSESTDKLQITVDNALMGLSLHTSKSVTYQIGVSLDSKYFSESYFSIPVKQEV